MPSARKPAVLTAATLLSVALALAGCGGGSSSPAVAHLSSKKGASSTSSGSGSSSPESPASLQQAMIAFAKCMRSHGVPNFPDPNASGGFPVRAGFDPRSPAVSAAQAKCRQFMPPGPGSGPPPSPQTLARFLKIARCMRQHGVSDFPDPRTTAPPNPFGSGISEISDIEGVILLFGSTIDQQSPVFTRAAAACAFPLHNH
ncbi:MAG TPA: hypothetical protein VK272_08950 [Solirubrobacteraceae bacterium]|nr:hypothetical protein [Solirubrobacteraceae bacterium]